MHKKNIKNPVILQVLPVGEIANLSEELVIRTKEIKNQSFSDVTLQRVIFDGAVFSNCIFEHVKISHFECMDVLFDNCQFINCEFIGSFIRRVVFRACRVIGMNLSESSIESLQMKDGIFEMGALYFSKIRGLSFESEVIRNSDFYELNIKNWYFNTCTLQGVEINKTPLKGIDFRTSTLEEMRLTLDSLEGVIVTPHQALVLSGLLGLDVREEWE